MASKCVLLTVILKPCLWQQSKFKDFQALPKDGKAITTWSNRDPPWLSVSEGLLKGIEKIALKRAEQTKAHLSKESEELLKLQKAILEGPQPSGPVLPPPFIRFDNNEMNYVNKQEFD